jgi:hypothetical protein
MVSAALVVMIAAAPIAALVALSAKGLAIPRTTKHIRLNAAAEMSSTRQVRMQRLRQLSTIGQTVSSLVTYIV